MDWERFDEIAKRIATGFGALSEMVPRVLDNPRGYPREAMLLAAFAGLAVLLTVLAVITIADGVRTSVARRRLGVRKRASARLVSALVTVSAALVIALGAAVLPMLPASGELCGGCHAVRPSVASWGRDAHASVACYGCHAAPGVTGAVAASLRGAGLRLASASPRLATTHAESCLACHRLIESRIVGTEIRVRHSDIIDAGTACIECHPDVGHADASAEMPSIVRSAMSRCLMCHDGEQAPADCETCHVGGPLDVAQAPRSAVTVAGGACADCHSAKTRAACIDCHGLELPHPPEFMRSHAALSWADPPLCVKCHETAAPGTGCACHGSEPNQHGSYEQWFPLHGPRAASAGPGGCLCHNNRNFAMCAFCHESYPW